MQLSSRVPRTKVFLDGLCRMKIPAPGQPPKGLNYFRSAQELSCCREPHAPGRGC